MHKPKTLVIPLNSLALLLWHIMVAPSDLLLEVINLYHIVKKHTITLHTICGVHSMNASKLNAVVALTEEHTQ